MKEKLIDWMNSRNYNSHLMRLLVGGYVAYLGIRILQNPGAGSSAVWQTICAVLFLILGSLIALVSLYAVFFAYSKEYKGKITSDSTPEESGENTEKT